MKRVFAFACVALSMVTGAMAQNDDVWMPKSYDKLYTRLGGVHKVAAIVDDFGNRMSMNDKVMMNPACKQAFSKGSLPFFKYEMTQWLCDRWGGPQKYMGPDMVAWHRAAKITDSEWMEGEKTFRMVLDKMMVPMEEQKMVGEFFMTFRKQMKMDGPTDFMMPMAPKESLYSRLGGAPAIAAVVDEFVNRLAGDPVVTGNKNVVKSLSSGKVTAAGIKFLVVEQLVMASGGPAKYSGRDMATAHKGLMITEDEWTATAKILKNVLDDFKVPEKEQGEIFGAIGGTKKDIVGK
ncbi:MAG: hypothetical protein JSS66_12850 [Armatimonadetes bacterium]|nr:hypothetical protein [Armatimonadota bacterium]